MLKFIVSLFVLFIVMIVLLVIVTVQPVFISAQQPLPAVTDQATLKSYVYHLSEELPPRSDDIDNLNTSAEYIHSVLSRFSQDVSYQEFEVDGETHKNVIARFGEPSNKCGTYVLGAHYDVFKAHPGADDNASGVAGMLELARLFSKETLACPVELVAYTLEEEIRGGRVHMGSYQHAKSIVDNNIELEWMISLEMIGYYSDEPNSQNYPLSILHALYPSKGNFIALVGNFDQTGITREIKSTFKQVSDFPVESINTSERVPGITWSDHASYWELGLPALMLTDTSYNRNFNYHTANDTWDTLDYQRMAKVVDAMFYLTLASIESHTKK